MDFQPGEPVRVADGDWAGCEGRVLAVDGDELRLLILVTRTEETVPAGSVGYDQWYLDSRKATP